jgi:hypothetical protein
MSGIRLLADRSRHLCNYLGYSRLKRTRLEALADPCRLRAISGSAYCYPSYATPLCFDGDRACYAPHVQMGNRGGMQGVSNCE